ncbi:pyruvate dehydrogenase complex subunit PDH-E1Alpha [Toxoplasma gondii RUB]|uniref:Pyruvate dehydrogenase E1 component subunit alpha n=1 Tax=Toxoplasma gondii RUB TaxID=935652 RepID=A0A086M6Z0_TOXGO|nr:pyruvate dehydrogenase complex subunit PDH-E1Alpha [Toxoplasma gondii RUB]
MGASRVSPFLSRETGVSATSELSSLCRVASCRLLPSACRFKLIVLLLALVASPVLRDSRFVGITLASALNPSSAPSSLPTVFSSAPTNSLPQTPVGPHVARVRLSPRIPVPLQTLSSPSNGISAAFVAPATLAGSTSPAPSFSLSTSFPEPDGAKTSPRTRETARHSVPSSELAAVARPSITHLSGVHPPAISPLSRGGTASSASRSHECPSMLGSERRTLSAAAARSGNQTGDFSSPDRSCLSPQQQHRELVSPYVGQMLLEDMLTGRMVEDACARLYYMGKTAGFVHLYTGQEAVSAGVIKLLRPDDAVVSTYRDHVHATSKGVPVREVMAELFGKATGCSRGRGGSMHMFSKKHNMIGGFAFIGEQIPVALGYAFSAAYRRFAMGDKSDSNADQVAVCFLGDGTTNMGQLYEALNIAALSKLPIVFVVENNNWAIGMAAQRSTATPAVWQRAESFGVAGVEVDGMDVLAVRGAARRAIDRARRGEGPTLIEALTYRFRGHSVADPDEMRAVKQKEAWVVRDPIKSFEEELKRLGYASDETIAATRAKVKAVVDDAVKFAETSPEPDVQECGQFIFAPPYTEAGKPEPLTNEQLHQYAVALKQELDAKARAKAGDKTPQPSVLQSANPPIVID